jgi:hypothetical protein
MSGSAETHLTKLMWTPRPRWRPLHSRHIKMPYETDAHCGFFVSQSTQTCWRNAGWDGQRAANDRLICY